MKIIILHNNGEKDEAGGIARLVSLALSREKQWADVPIEVFAEDARTALLERGIPLKPEAFAAAVRAGDAETARLCLEAGFPPDTKDKAGVPVLSLAARGGHLGLVELLLAQEASVNQKSADRGNTALIDAALGKHSDIIEVLLKAGADVNAVSNDGQSALVIAAGHTDIITAELLLKAGALPDLPDALGTSARKYAALFHNSDMMALFANY